MVTINIDGLGSIKVDDSFKNMSPEEQQKIVDEIYNSSQQRNAMAQPQSQGYFAETLGNVPGSAKQFASDIAQPFLSPIETAKSLYDLGSGIVQLAIPGEQGDENVARAVGAYLGQRYGGLENVKNTFKEDPVGVLGDLSLILTGGAGLAVKTAGTTGKIGRIASAAGAAGRAIDPLTIASKAVSVPAKGVSEVAKTVLGGATGVGRISIDEALKAGREAENTLLQSMRGLVKEEDTALKVSNAVDNMEATVKSAYAADLEKIASAGRADMNVAASNVKTFLNEYRLTTKSDAKLKMADKIESDVDKYLEDPSAYTIQGLDQLKQDIDALRMSDANPQLNRLVTRSRNLVKDEIIRQFPEYKNIMERYSKPMGEIEKIRKQLSINKFNLNTVSLMSKLQSSLKELAGSSTRRAMLEGLDKNLIPEIAGQALSSASPRGIPSSLAGLGVLVDPSFLLGIPATMPRVVGEGAYKIGQAQRLGQQVGQAVSPVLSPMMTGARVTRPIQQPLEEQRQGLLNR